MKTEYLECSCHSPEHTLKFSFDEEDPDFPVYISVFLSELPWYKRILEAIKYLLGYKCKYGHFDEFILEKEDCDRLIKLLEEYKKI